MIESNHSNATGRYLLVHPATTSQDYRGDTVEELYLKHTVVRARGLGRAWAIIDLQFGVVIHAGA